jgi:hypothetical protein
MNRIDEYGYAPGDILTRKMGPFTRSGVYLGGNRVFVHDFKEGKKVVSIAEFAQGRMPTVERTLDLPAAEIKKKVTEAVSSTLRFNPFEGVATVAAPPPDPKKLFLRASALAAAVIVPLAVYGALKD